MNIRALVLTALVACVLVMLFIVFGVFDSR